MESGKFGVRRQVALRFELPEVETENGEPCVVFHMVFNLSMRSKAFREMAVSLMGTSDLHGSSVREMLGKACKVTIVHRETDDGLTFANIASFKALRPGMKPPQVDSDSIFFSLDPVDAPDLKSLQRDFDALPESEQTRIAASPTWKELLATRQLAQAARGKRAKDIVHDSVPGEDGKPFDDGFPKGLGDEEPEAA